MTQDRDHKTRDQHAGDARQALIRPSVVRTLTARLLISALVSSVLAMTVGGYILALSFRSYVRTDVDQELVSFLDSMAGVTEIGPDGVIRFATPLFDQRFQEPYSGWYWQISEEGKPAFRSRSLWDYEIKPDLDNRQFALEFHTLDGPDGQVLRVAEQDLMLPEADHVYRFMVATDVQKTEAAIHRFDGLLFGGVLAIVLTITMIMALQTSFGLRPVRALRAKLSDVRSGKADKLDGEWGADLAPVAAEVNALIDHNHQLIGRARTHVGNLAHALKTPLSVLANEVRRAQPDADVMERQLRAIQRHVDHHLKRARIAGGGAGPGVDVSERMQKLVAAVKHMHSDKAVALRYISEDNLIFAGEREDFDEVSGNLLDNACKWCVEAVAVYLSRVRRGDRDMIRMVVCDDGPGVPQDQWETLFERGQRLDEQVPGTGLGLAIVRDIVELYGGECQVGQAELGGLEVIILLPAKT